MTGQPRDEKEVPGSDTHIGTEDIFVTAVSAPKNGMPESELSVILQQESATAETRKINADAADKEKLTELKESYAGMVMFFLWFWFGALCLLMVTYLTYQMVLGLEIPKEIIIAAFTSTAVVVGLVGYILKGLFGSKT